MVRGVSRYRFLKVHDRSKGGGNDDSFDGGSPSLDRSKNFRCSHDGGINHVPLSVCCVIMKGASRVYYSFKWRFRLNSLVEGSRTRHVLNYSVREVIGKLGKAFQAFSPLHIAAYSGHDGMAASLSVNAHTSFQAYKPMLQ